MNIQKSQLKKIITITCLIIFFTTIWIIQNDSFVISRDEMWYTDYSVKFNDTETNDIRHITEYDLHQSAFPVVFRVMQRANINILGKNIFSLRFLNLVFGLLLIVCVGSFLFKRNISIFWLFIYLILILFDTVVTKQSHILRPDWIFETTIVISILLLFDYLEKHKIKYLYIISILGGFSVGIYWNGLAAVAAFYVIITLLLINKKILRIDYIKVLFISFLSVFIFFILPLLFYKDETISLFQNDGLQTSSLASGNTIKLYLASFINLLSEIFKFSKYNLMIGSVSILVFFLFLVLICKSKKQQFISNLLYVGLWVIVYILVIIFRGGGIRFLYFLIPLLYFILLFILGELREDYNKKWYVLLPSIYVVLYCLIITANTSIYINNNKGQWVVYNQYSKDIKGYFSEKEGKVFTSFDFSWALEGNDKFYMETISFIDIKSDEEFSCLLKDNNVNYVLVGERSRLRMKGEDEFGIGKEWYRYWDIILKDEFILAGSVYNKFYRHNKGLAPKNPDGFQTEIWVRNKK
ncbi:MAG: glycosyltransferase family 39 protein [Spirochaetaceae bacterium]